MSTDTLKKITVKTYQQQRLLCLSAIIYCCSMGRYADIILEGDEMVKTLHSLKRLEKIVNEGLFYRCHKQYIVNIDHIEVLDNTRHQLTLSNGFIIKYSRYKKNQIKEMINNFYIIL